MPSLPPVEPTGTGIAYGILAWLARAHCSPNASRTERTSSSWFTGFRRTASGPYRNGALSELVISVSRNEHDRDSQTPRRQLLLHLKTAHFRHRKVQNHARDQAQLVRPQKLPPRREGLDLESERPEKPLERVTEGLIVVDDGDDASLTLADLRDQTPVAHQPIHRPKP